MNLKRHLLIAILIMLSACADLQTIERRTTLPFSKIAHSVPATDVSKDADGIKGADGVAIHLDAQQRLVMFHLDKYCAEPSPDALAAYAASLGLGVSNPSKTAASLAQGMQSSAGNIGLRTQSITLMRDALYRMCEAANNKHINSIEVAKLLHQSQDLTAVILAVEQLTGAVAANQIVLGGTTSSDATASLISNQQALDSVRKSEVNKKKDFDDATTAKQAAEKNRADKKVSLQEAQKKVADLPSDAKQADRNAANQDHDKKQAEFDLANNDVRNASDLYDLRKKIYEDAITLRQQIEAQKDSVFTYANAATTTSGQFSVLQQRSVLSKEATEAIANSVQAMVQLVLTKDYSSDACMSYLTQPKRDSTNPEIEAFCKEIVQTSVWIANKQLHVQRARLEAEFEMDDNTDALTTCLKDKQKKDKLDVWLKNNNYSSVPKTILLYGKEFDAARKVIVNSGVCQ